MSVNLRQGISTTVSQQMVMTVQQQQSLKLLQYSALELDTELKRALQDNPLLEIEAESSAEDSENYSTRSTDDFSTFFSEDEEEFVSEMQAKLSLQDYLFEQLSTCQADDLHKTIISFLIGDLDENGYLSTDITTLLHLLSEELGFAIDYSDGEKALHILQSFDPAGIGAKTLSECLLLQLDEQRLSFDFDHDILAIARTICATGLEALAQADIQSLSELAHASLEQIRLAHQLIKRLDPRPGKQYSAPEADLAIPDILCRQQNGAWEVYLNPQVLPKIRIQPEYERLLKVMDKKTLAHNAEISEQLKQAKVFLTQLNQRFATILAVAQTIMQEQYDFFKKGLAGLKPLTLHQIAEQLALHESTISRAINQKFIATPHGVFELKRFFSSSLSTQEGENTSAVAIQERIKALINAESKEKPLSDSKLTSLLESEGIEIARRTVAKYRELLGIPTASLRKAQAILKG